MSEFEKRKFLVFIIGVLFLVLVVFEVVSFGNKQNDILEVSYLDIGQGDATLISYLGKYQILIDGGPSGRKLLEELGKQMPIMDKKIEIVILTHPDFDHLAGLIDVVKNYEVGVFLGNGASADTQIFEELESVLLEKNIEKEILTEDSKISIGNNLNFEIFNPDDATLESKDRNENSIVLRMDFGINSFLFTGDATGDIEKDMITDGENIDVDWLKIGHHGSKHSTTEEFLVATSPKFTIISVGARNKYKHPAVEVLELIGKVGVPILRTDENGTIEVFCRIPNEECVLR